MKKMILRGNKRDRALAFPFVLFVSDSCEPCQHQHILISQIFMGNGPRYRADFVLLHLLFIFLILGCAGFSEPERKILERRYLSERWRPER